MSLELSFWVARISIWILRDICFREFFREWFKYVNTNLPKATLSAEYIIDLLATVFFPDEDFDHDDDDDEQTVPAISHADKHPHLAFGMQHYRKIAYWAIKHRANRNIWPERLSALFPVDPSNSMPCGIQNYLQLRGKCSCALSQQLTMLVSLPPSLSQIG